MRLGWRGSFVGTVVVLGACGGAGDVWSGNSPVSRGEALVAVRSLVDIVGMTSALSAPAQRHVVRLQPTDHAPVFLLAAQNDGYTYFNPGLVWYRSDDGGASWSRYFDIAARPDPAAFNGSRQPATLHLTTDLLPVGDDIAAVYSYDATDTGFPADAWDPGRVVYFQWWRFDGRNDWAAGPRLTIASPGPGQAYHRAEIARDSLGRLWVQAFLRQNGCPTPGSTSCAGDLVQVWVSTDGGSSFQGPQTLAFLRNQVGGGRLATVGSKLLLIWADTSLAAAQMMTRNDSDPITTWSPQRNAFPDGAHIYHGAGLSSVDDGAGGLHLVYKEWVSNPDNQQLYYRHFEGNAFGSKTPIGSVGDWALQPAVTRAGNELYVCTNQTISPGTNFEMRSYRLGAGFATWSVIDAEVNGKAYPAAPEVVAASDATIPCAFGMGNQTTDWWGPGHTVQVAQQPVPAVSVPVAATPTFSPAPGTFTSAQSVTITDATTGARIFYTTDGTAPTTSSTPYTAPIPVSATTTLRAIAAATGFTSSAVATATYTIQAVTPVAATPTFSPAPGTFTSAQSVTITDATTGARVFYTTDGTAPTTSSTPYTAPIPVSTTTTLRAVAVATGFTSSAVATATYTIQPPGRVALFSDDFARASGLGPSWKVWFGNYATDGASAISSTVPIQGNWASVVSLLGTNDYAVSATLAIPAGAFFSGIVARGNPGDVTSDLYSAQISSLGSVNLYRRNAWDWTLLGSTPASIVSGSPYSLQLSVKGSSPVHLEVSLNGTILITLDDASPGRLPTGVPGIENYDQGVRYDRFDVLER